MAVWWFDGLRYLVPEEIAELAPLHLDYGVLVFAVAASVLTALLCGAAPVAQSFRPNVIQALRQGDARAGAGRGARRFRSGMVVAQVALSLVLLIGAGLLLRTFASLRGVDPGFRPDNVLTMRVRPSSVKYPEPAQRSAFARQILDRVEALPGVVSAGFTIGVPVAFPGWVTGITVEGESALAPGERPTTNYRVVTPDYRRTMGIPLRRGREIDETDGPEAPHVAMVNETMARKFWPGEDPLGKRFRTGDGPWTSIVGVVGDVKQAGRDVPAKPEMYLSYRQQGNFPSALAIRTRQDPLSLTDAVRRAIKAVDAEQPVSAVASMEQILDREVFQRRVQAILLGAFAALALVVAALGVYGVISYLVQQNTHEIGVRAALGARPAEILSNVLRRGLRLALAGMGVGLVAAFGLTRFLSHLLFGVSPRDPLTFTLVTAGVVLVALLATALPARRATKIDPMVALRHE